MKPNHKRSGGLGIQFGSEKNERLSDEKLSASPDSFSAATQSVDSLLSLVSARSSSDRSIRSSSKSSISQTSVYSRTSTGTPIPSPAISRVASRSALGTPSLATDPTEYFDHTPKVNKKRPLLASSRSSFGFSTPTHSSRKPASTSSYTIPEGQIAGPCPAPPIITADSTRMADDLIDEMLEENQRGNVELFVRKASTPRLGWLSTPRNKFAPFRSSATLDSPSPACQPQLPNNDDGSFDSGDRSVRAKTYSGAEILSQVSGSPDSHSRSLSTGFSPASKYSPSPLFANFSNRVLKKFPGVPNIAKRARLPSQVFPFFTKYQEARIRESVFAEGKVHSCERRHENCTDCINLEFAYQENLRMSSSLISADERQKIIANNKSLRTIKNELDTLLDNNMISEDTYGTIIDALPSESPLNSAARRNVTQPTPIAASHAPQLSSAIESLRLNNNRSASNDPPSYNASTNGPPALPGRASSQSQPERPEIARAQALYAYPGGDEDCSFAIGAWISVYEYMNEEWCYGKNLDTGSQGLFPKNYVHFPKNQPPNPSAYGAYGSEKQGGYQGGYQQSQGPPPPGQSNPYNAAVPPMAVAEQPADGKPSKFGETGKKFGKKLGNAAIFGAGATMGADLVNSIF